VINNLHFRPESLPDDAPDILRGISLRIKDGEFVSIIGENGSGKTTFIKHLNGLYMPSEGTVSVLGLDTSLVKNHCKLRSLVGLVLQNPADQIVASTVEEDIAFGLENLNLPTPEIKTRVAEQLQNAGLLEEAQRPPHLLSGGQIQKLALAGVLARHPKLILFDEPTAMLDPLTRNIFLKQICNLHQQGKTILYVTHQMEEAVHTDRILVFKEGQVLLDGPPDKIFSTPEILYEVGLDIPKSTWFSRQFQQLGWQVPGNVLTPEALIEALPTYQGSKTPPGVKASLPSAETIIHLEEVSYTYLSDTPLAKRALQNASLDVADHSVHGLAGANGSGKSTLLQHINGILRPEKGQVEVNSVAVSSPDTPLREVIAQVGLVFQNPETQFFSTFVGDEIAYGPKQLNFSDVRGRVREAMAWVGLEFEAYKDRRLETLSGGEKRKVALASTLILDPEVLLFDEPTAGMDPSARDDLMALFLRLKNQGKTLLIASHRLDELAEVTDRLSLMHKGKVTATGKTFEVLFDTDSVSDVGLTPPLAIRLSQALIEKGWPIEGFDTSTPSLLMEALKECVD
jgi:energy-coupling factor transport system ATP-binding protein